MVDVSEGSLNSDKDIWEGPRVDATRLSWALGGEAREPGAKA